MHAHVNYNKSILRYASCAV